MPLTIEFDEEEISRYYSEGATGGPVFLTSILSNPHGAQQRNVTRYDGIHEFKFNFKGAREKTEFAELLDFFMTRSGRAVGFRFFPYFDNSWTNEEIAKTSKSTAAYNLIRTYRTGSRTKIRRIVKPNADPPLVVKINGQDASTFSQYSVDYTRGKIVFETKANLPEGGSLTVDGEYCIPVCFDTDRAEVSGYGGYMDLEGLGVVELLPAALGIYDTDPATYAPDTFLPTVPTNVSAVPLVSQPTTALLVSWNASTALNGKTIKRYKVRVNGAVSLTANADTVYPVGSLQPDTFYTIAVAAVDSNGVTGAFSANITAKTGAVTTDTSPPEVPQGVTASMLSSNSIRVSWIASSDTGGGSVKGYVVDLGHGFVYDVGKVLTKDIGSLPANTTFQVRVLAYDSATPRNESAYSETVTVSPVVTTITPTAPIWTVSGRVLTLAHPDYPVSEYEVSTGGGLYAPYTQPFNVGDAARAEGYYKGRIKQGTNRNSGTPKDSPAFSAVVANNAAPTASNVTVTGNERVGQTLTGTFAYVDANGDAEGTHVHKWYRADKNPTTGAITNRTLIVSTSSASKTNQYTLAAIDAGKVIEYAPVPVAAVGTNSPTEYPSGYTGLIANLQPAAPTLNAATTSDANNTAGWNNVPGFAAFTFYEFSYTQGTAPFVDATGNPHQVPDNTYQAGDVRVRVKAATGRDAGAWLLFPAFTASATPPPPSGGVVGGGYATGATGEYSTNESGVYNNY